MKKQSGMHLTLPDAHDADSGKDVPYRPLFMWAHSSLSVHTQRATSVQTPTPHQLPRALVLQCCPQTPSRWPWGRW